MNAAALDLQRAAERSFGGLWDALGLRPVREMQQAALALADARVDELVAQGHYACVTAGAWMTGLCGVAGQLEALRRGGEPGSSATALLRLWVGELDTAMHAAMLSAPGLAAMAATVRAGSRRRSEQQRMVALGSEALGIPTRGEVDAAFREIQQLKREVRRLEKQAAQGARTKRPR